MASSSNFRNFRAEKSGSVAVIFGLSATALIGLVGGAIDYSRLILARNQLQMAVDAGVMAGGNSLKLVSSNSASITGVTTQVIQTELKVGPNDPASIHITVADDKTSVAARVEKSVKFAFGPFIGLSSMKVAAQAKASVVGKMRLCMLALDQTAAGAFNLEKSAQVTAYDCALYSNSNSASGMVGQENSLALAHTICSVGGAKVSRANFTPNPQSNCPPIRDPLADRAAPSIGSCIKLPASVGKQPKSGQNLINSNITLNPGTYCGGLQIEKTAVVNLNPGIYVIKDGPLSVIDSATLSGTGVAFFFTGSRGSLLFDKGSTINLSAPVSGPMAGLLMSEERTVTNPVDPVVQLKQIKEGGGDDDDEDDDGGGSSTTSPLPRPTPPPLASSGPMRTYRIISDNARTMLGTIYLPVGRLVIDASRPVSDRSAYTVVVAKQINLYEGPNLYLNANYSNTGVPVPNGVGPRSGRLLLTQ